MSDFHARFQEKTDILEDMYKSLENGGTPNLTSLSQDVAKLCDEVQASPSSVQEEMQPVMKAMIKRLNEVVVKLRDVHGQG